MKKDSLADLSVLVIDDDPDFRELLKLALEKLGTTRVTAVGNARAALEFIQKGAQVVHVVLLDLDMPDMNGIAFLHSIRGSNEGRLAFLPVIVVTAYDTERVKEGVEPFGILGFLGKPPDAVQLERLLKSVPKPVA
jgi:CheY-like chemotaxis protein